MEYVRPVEATDTDLYNYTQGQVIYHHYPGVDVRYKFKCRNNDETIGKDTSLTKEICNMVNRSLDDLCKLGHTEDELRFINHLRFIKPTFVQFLQKLRLNRDHIKCHVLGNELHIEITGPWKETLWFEQPTLYFITESYTKLVGNPYEIQEARHLNLVGKTDYLLDNYREDLDFDKFQFSDFGTRRRSSYSDQLSNLQTLKKVCEPLFSGTSNVHFARLLDLNVHGTMAHQYICAHQQLGPSLINCQTAAFDTWIDEYQGDLGIALSDTMGFDAFLRDFGLYYAKLFDGARHDSGDPYEKCSQFIRHLQSLNINPMCKTFLFSDGLTIADAVKLFRRFYKEINVAFGIGTNLMNDVGLIPPKVVIKMVECNGRPVAKIADSSGKGMCEDLAFEQLVRNVFRVR